MVYVISKDGNPLMSCCNVIARLLLKQGKAQVKKREPFTIKLNYETTTRVSDRAILLNASTFCAAKGKAKRP